MATLPQLLEEDVQSLDATLSEFIEKSDATTALIIDKGGFLITHWGDSRQYDLTTIAALASGAFMANQTIANLVHETNFNSVYQQGDKSSMFVMGINDEALLVVIFKATVSVGAVKYFAMPAAQKLAQQFKVAHERDPGGGFDLSVLNIADSEAIFRRKSA